MSDTTKTDEFDLWGGESGFKDDYDGLIIDAFFTKDQKYNNGETLFLDLKIIADDGEEVEQIYPCGADWDSFDNGATAEHPKDKETKPKTFNHQSAMFGLMSHAFEAGAEGELRGRGSPRMAAIWQGLKFHWRTETTSFTMKDRVSGEPVTRTTTRTYPEKFLGVFDVETGQAGAAAPATAAGSGAAAAPATAPATAAPPAQPAPAPAASNGAGAFDLSGFDAAVIAKLKVHAKSKPYTEFIDAALAVDGVTENDELLSLIGQESFHAHLRG